MSHKLVRKPHCAAAGNVVQSLTLSFLVPLTIAAFTLDLPYLDPSPPLQANFVLGSTVMFGGLLTYNSPKYLPAIQKKLGKDS